MLSSMHFLCCVRFCQLRVLKVEDILNLDHAIVSSCSDLNRALAWFCNGNVELCRKPRWLALFSHCVFILPLLISWSNAVFCHNIHIAALGPGLVNCLSWPPLREVAVFIRESYIFVNFSLIFIHSIHVGDGENYFNTVVELVSNNQTTS